MNTLEERLKYVEGKVEDHSKAIVDLRDLMVALDQKVDRRFDALEQRLDRRFELIDSRFESIDSRFESIDRRFESVDRRFESVEHRFESVEHRFQSLEQRFDNKFNRLITIQLMTLVALVAGLFGTVGALLRQ